MASMVNTKSTSALIASQQTLGALKRSGYRSKTVKQEMRDNLIEKLKSGQPLLPGLLGYQDTVKKQLQHALLAQHDILLLGLRGQGKTRLLRQLVDFLDEQIPIIAGSEVNDDPLAPISKFGRDQIASHGDETPIEWIGRDKRYGEKLATPDVSIGDLIGDIDPVKAIQHKLTYGHEGIIQFGIIPRTNRGIFVINELPDLQARIQVALLNIMEERDIQIRGFRLRFPLDLMMAFSANPEDYTNRGNIITPLKDRIDSQIITHYPKNVETAMEITQQEAAVNLNPEGLVIEIPKLIQQVAEQIAFEARADKDYVDQKSGVSARLSIAAYELLASSVELRARKNNEKKATARFMDLESVVPALTGKLELVYAGEQEGPANIARALIARAVKTVFHNYFRDPYNKKEKSPEENPYYAVLSWFAKGNSLTMSDTLQENAYATAIQEVSGLDDTLAKAILPGIALDTLGPRQVLREFLLEGLSSHARLSKENLTEGFVYRDMMMDIMRG